MELCPSIPPPSNIKFEATTKLLSLPISITKMVFEKQFQSIFETIKNKCERGDDFMKKSG